MGHQRTRGKRLSRRLRRRRRLAHHYHEGGYRRRLFQEQLEERRMLSGTSGPFVFDSPHLDSPTFAAPVEGDLGDQQSLRPVLPVMAGMHLVDTSVNHFAGQVIYLDFDGAEDVTYNGPVTVGPFDVPAFEASGDLAGQEQEIIASVVAQLEATFAGSGVVFMTEQPALVVEYSTIYIGGDGSEFSQYGSFIGLSEKTDAGNLDSSDEAFVFSDAFMSNVTDEGSLATNLSGFIAHEAGHLLGHAHSGDEGNGNILSDFSASIISAYWWEEGTTVPEGTLLHARAQVSGFSTGTQFTFKIYEHDFQYDDYVTTMYGSVWSENGNLYVGVDWTSVWQDDGVGNPEFYFQVLYGSYKKWARDDVTVTKAPDTTRPQNPTSFSSTPGKNTWSKDNTVDVSWSGESGASDAGGLKGYYYKWTTSSSSSVSRSDTYKSDTTGSSSRTSSGLPDGSSHYFHVRYEDTSDNLASSTAHYGPFKIDRTDPGKASRNTPGNNGSVSTTRPTLDWDSAGDGSGSGVNEYHLKVVENWFPYIDIVDKDVEGTSYRLSSSESLEWTKTYTWFLYAIDRVGNKGDYTTEWAFTVADTTRPQNPTSFSSTPGKNTWSKDNTVDVSWSGESGASDAGGLKGYYYKWTTSSSSSVSRSDTYKSNTTGSSSRTSSGLSDGSSHYFHVRYEDTSDNLASSTAHYGPFKIDRTDPEKPELSSPDHNSETGDQTPKFDWDPAGDGSGSVSGTHHYEIEVWDGWTWEDISDTTTSSDYTPGSNIPYDTVYWKTRAVDTAGNDGSWSDTWTLKIVPPEIVRAYWLDPHEVSEGTAVTMRAQVKGFDVDDQFTFEIWEDDGAAPDQRPPNVTTRTGNVYLSGSDYYVSATWTAEWMADIQNDPEYFFVVSRGNVSLTSSSTKADQMTVLPLQVEIPDAWICPDLTSCSSFSDIDGDGYASSLSVHYKAKTDAGSKKVYAKLLRDNLTIGQTTLTVGPDFDIGTSLLTRTLAYTNTEQLTKGSHDLQVRLYDAYSHDEVAKITEHDDDDLLNILIEKTSDEIPPPPKPTGVRISSSSAEDTGSDQNDGITKKTTPLFVWNAPDVPTGILRYEYKRDNESTVHSTLSTSANWRPGLLVAFDNGEHSIRFRAVEKKEDRPGSWSDVYTFRIDTVKPGKPTLSSPDHNSETGDQTPTFDWEPVSSRHHYEIEVWDGDLSWGDISDTTTSSDYTPGSNIPHDTVYWKTRAVDTAGNDGPWSDTWTLKIMAPELTSVQWKTSSGGTVSAGQRFKVGNDVRIYVEANYAQVGDKFTVYVYEDDGADFDDLIDTKEVTILNSTGTKGTGYVTWEVPWHPDNNFLSDLGIGDIQPEYRIWDTMSGWTWWPANTQRSDVIIEAHGGELPAGMWTVITHGLQMKADSDTYSDLTNPTVPGAWMWQLANKIRYESINPSTGSSNVIVHKMKIVDGLIELWTRTGQSEHKSTAAEIQLSTKHHVLLYDWAQISNLQTIGEGDDRFRLFTSPPPPGSHSEDGFAEAAGEALYTLLSDFEVADQVDTLIGHSRGSIVMSETASRLLADGVSVDQVVFVDAEGGGDDPVFSDPAFSLYSDQEYYAWSNIDTTNIFSGLNEGLAAKLILALVTGGLSESVANSLTTKYVPNVDLGGHSVAGATNVDLGDLSYVHSRLGPVAGVYDYLIGGVFTGFGTVPGLFVLNGDIRTVKPGTVNGSTRDPALDAPESFELFNGDFDSNSTAGWWYHGGDSPSSNPDNLGSVIADENGNSALVLFRNDSRTHNWSYVPDTANSVIFDYKIGQLDAPGQLVVEWFGSDTTSSKEIARIDLASVSNWNRNQIFDLPPGINGNVGRVKFSVTGGNNILTTWIDNITWSDQFAPAPEIDVARGNTRDVHAHNFGDLRIGQSTSQTFDVHNEGNLTLTVTQASGLNDPFQISDTNGSGSGDDWTILPDNKRSFTVTFTPVSATSYFDTLTLLNTDKDESSYIIDFRGNGTTPEIDLERGNTDDVHVHNFGDLRIGQSTSQAFFVHNEGNATLTVTQASGLNSPFQISDTNGSGSGDDWTILPGNKRSFTVTFSPVSATSYSDKLTLKSDDLDEASYLVDFTGTGISPDIDVELAGQPNNVHSYTFGEVGINTTVTKQFTVRNEGTEDLRVKKASGLADTPFAIIPANGSSDGDDWIIEKDRTRQFTISFSPTTLEAFNENLTLLSDDPDEINYVIALSGTGSTAGTRITINPGSQTIGMDSPAGPIGVDVTDSTGDTPFRLSFESSNSLLVSAPDTINNVSTGEMTVTAFPTEPGQTGTATLTISISNTSGPGNSVPFNLTVVADYGDAPTSYYTTLADNGPRHTASGPLLGTRRDAETDAATPLNGTGDDVTDTGAADDEDGVVIPTLLEGTVSDISVNVQDVGNQAVLQGWIDLNGNGKFEHPGEQVINATVTENGTVSFPFTPPVGAAGSTYARFRVSTAGNLSPTGPAANGEVEDYAVTIQKPAEIYGTKFHDVNANGLRDAGEPGLAGWTIDAYIDQDSSGSWNAGEPKSTTVTRFDDPTTSDINEAGMYALTGLTDGRYTVEEVNQSGWLQTYPKTIQDEPLSAGLVAHYEFEGSLDIFEDFNAYAGGSPFPPFNSPWQLTTPPGNIDIRIDDTVSFELFGKSLHFVDQSSSSQGEIRRYFQPSTEVSLDYYMRSNTTSDEGAFVGLRGNAGNDLYVGFQPNGYIGISKDSGWIEDQFLPYRKGEWYHVQRTWDSATNTGSVYVAEVSGFLGGDSLIYRNTLEDVSSYAQNSFVDEVRIWTSGYWGADAYIDNIRISDVEFGSSLRDSSGNNNHGTMPAESGKQPTLVADRFGNDNSAYRFDGGDYFKVSNSSALNMTTSVTFATWVYADRVDGGYIMNKSTSGNEPSFSLGLTGPSQGEGNFQARVNTDPTSYNVHSAADAPVDTWTHVAGVYDGSTLKIYVNGAESNSLDVSGDLLHNNKALYFGCDCSSQGDVNSGFYGRIDDVRIYNRALSANSVNSLYRGDFSSSGGDGNSSGPSKHTVTLDVGQVVSGIDFGNAVDPDHVNVAPENLVPNAPKTDENAPLVFSTGNGNPISVKDEDEGGLGVQATLAVNHGILTVATTAGLTSVVGDRTATVTIQGPITAVNLALNGLTYTPDQGFFGTASLQVSTDDLGHSGKEGSKTDIDNVSIAVEPLNKAPTLDAIANITIDEDASEQTVNLAGITAGGGESQPLKVTATSSNTSLAADPIVTYLSAESTGTIKFTPIHDQFGSTTITVTVKDGGFDGNLNTGNDNATFSRTFDVTVTPVNDAPVASTGNYQPIENTTLTVTRGQGLETLVDDVEGDSLTYSLVTQTAYGQMVLDADGSFTYTPDTNFNRTDSFSYRAHDGQLASDTATVTLQIDTTYVWYNGKERKDVDDNGYVTAGDALQIIEVINNTGIRELSKTRDEGVVKPFLDVNRDNYLAPHDVLWVVDFLNQQAAAGAEEGEGESKGAALVIDQLMRNSTSRIHRPERMNLTAATITNSLTQPALDNTPYWQQVDETFSRLGRRGSSFDTAQTDDEQLDWWEFLDEEMTDAID